eukprot:TRINITY_DN437_c0_g1::TRINITY_DN437_c0_g1_i1::g.2508::m.2508 TRINITY_DN437_c0_g1::TRINITY_DN437_c0_g1_i1::g.2508  ORF type:complete len:625 (-),score=219.07,sp/P25795/AL7A1_PEA/35.26/3e-82,Aldedh/PF00171.17/8e-100,LuxC/PF05893.9/0.018 TRINITY_DN437_c0_g1_i1:41-1915(-)
MATFLSRTAQTDLRMQSTLISRFGGLNIASSAAPLAATYKTSALASLSQFRTGIPASSQLNRAQNHWMQPLSDVRSVRPFSTKSKMSSEFVKIGGARSVPLSSKRDTLVAETLKKLHLGAENPGVYPVVGTNDTPQVDRFDPTTGKPITKLQNATWEQIDLTLKKSVEVQKRWAKLSADRRLEIVTEMNEALRANDEALANLLIFEVGKIRTEAHGELVEIYDLMEVIQHRAGELGGDKPYYTRDYDSLDPKRRALGWKGQCRHLPLGVLGKVTAFNFPYAVFGWGALPALCVGNSVFLKPHPDSSLTSFAMVKVMADVAAKHGFDGLVSIANVSDWRVTQQLWKDMRVDMWEVTGSVPMGQAVMNSVGPSFRRVILELGGNNAVIVHEDGDVKQAVEACVFGAAGTAGQRCTTTRMIYVHEKHFDIFAEGLKNAYLKNLHIGDPLQAGVNVGPVHHTRQVERFKTVVADYKKAGSKLLCGGEVIEGNFVEPAIFVAPHVGYEAIKEEQFVPIVHLIKYKTSEFDQILDEINSMGYGLSGGLFTADSKLFEKAAETLRLGIFNQNYGSSGAEAGENFGGEGKTGNARMMGPLMFDHYRRPLNSMRAPAGGKIVHAQGVHVDVEA